jgi:APA family basic amino acid/polyamine antiporter
VAIVSVLYIACNLVYLNVLTFDAIQHADKDRVATAAVSNMFGPVAVQIMAAAIMISTFGCINGMVMAGARAYFAMARDGLFFKPAARVNRAHVPGSSLVMQGLWAAFLVLIRTHDPATGAYGNLYSNLLDYVVSAALLFYILTIAGLFRLRALRPDAERPYRAFGYPVVPALYILIASLILAVLVVYRPATTFPGVVIVLIGIPVYFVFRGAGPRPADRN